MNINMWSPIACVRACIVYMLIVCHFKTTLVFVVMCHLSRCQGHFLYSEVAACSSWCGTVYTVAKRSLNGKHNCETGFVLLMNPGTGQVTSFCTVSIKLRMCKMITVFQLYGRFLSYLGNSYCRPHSVSVKYLSLCRCI